MQWENIKNGVWHFRAGCPEELTPVKLRFTSSKDTKIVDDGAENQLPHITRDEIAFKTYARGCLISLPLQEAEAIYGFGLQLSSFKQNGRKKTIRTNSDPVGDLGDSHAPVPFYLSTLGYGIFIDTARYAAFYCGSHNDGCDDIGTTPEELYSLKKNKASRMSIDIPVAQGVDIYYFSGPTMLNALQRYNLFSGGGAMPPEWGLGIFYRGYSQNNDKDTIKSAQIMRNDTMPCDCFGLEPGWQSKAYSCSYLWDQERFPQPSRFIQTMDGMGFKVNLWEQLYIHPTNPLHASLAPYSGNVRVWDGLVVDFSQPQARKIFRDYHEKEFISKGIGGFKVDECDNSDFIKVAWSFPEYSTFPSNLDGEQMHSMIGIFGQQMLFEEYQKWNRRTWSNIRASHALAAPYPFVLYSDLYDHRQFIRGIVTAAMGGILWTPEVRQCNSEHELLRRLQSVIFSPMALINGWMIKHFPWKQFDLELNNTGQLLNDNGALTAKCADILRLRMSLIPYLYDAFSEYYFKGIGVFRPPVLDYPHHEILQDVDDAYMVGRDLYFAPMVTGDSQRKVFLPPGQWYNFFSRQKFDGDQEYEFSPANEEMLLFVRSGALIPWAEPLEYITSESVYRLTLMHFGENKHSSCKLYADDGVSFAYAESGDCQIRIDVDATTQQYTLHAAPNARIKRYSIQRVQVIK